MLHRPKTVLPEQKDKAAPALLEFDVAGNFIQAWGGPGPGYEWFETEHGLSFDNKGNIWLAGSGAQDGQLLKFTRDGKFLMQIGHSGQSKGNTDKENVKRRRRRHLLREDQRDLRRRRVQQPADHRVRRRHRGVQADVGSVRQRRDRSAAAASGRPRPRQRAAAGRTRPVKVPAPTNSTWCTRRGSRTTAWSMSATAPTSACRCSRLKASTSRRCSSAAVKWPPSTLTGMLRGSPLSNSRTGLHNARMTASRTAFSPDKEQRFLYVLDRPKQQIAILDRKTLEILGYFGGGIGGDPGQFYVLHDIVGGLERQRLHRGSERQRRPARPEVHLQRDGSSAGHELDRRTESSIASSPGRSRAARTRRSSRWPRSGRTLEPGSGGRSRRRSRSSRVVLTKSIWNSVICWRVQAKTSERHYRTPSSVQPRRFEILSECEADLNAGSLIIVEENRYRVRRLPIH